MNKNELTIIQNRQIYYNNEKLKYIKQYYDDNQKYYYKKILKNLDLFLQTINVTLYPTINLTTIEEYEKKYDLTLPPHLRNYLLFISCELIRNYSLQFENYVIYKLYLIKLKEPELHFIHNESRMCHLHDNNLDNIEAYDNWDLNANTATDEIIKILNDNGYYANYFIIIDDYTDDHRHNIYVCIKGQYYGYEALWDDANNYLYIDKLFVT